MSQVRKPKMSAREKLLTCAREALDRKAANVVTLDMAELTSFADYFVICSGKSNRQVQAIADNIERRLKDKGVRPLSVEGYQQGHWILLDYGDVIAHVFYEPVRELYDLESLWSDARRIEVGVEATSESTES